MSRGSRRPYSPGQGQQAQADDVPECSACARQRAALMPGLACDVNGFRIQKDIQLGHAQGKPPINGFYVGFKIPAAVPGVVIE